MTVSADLVVKGVTWTGIVLRLVNTVVFVRVRGSIEVVDPFVIVVAVTGHVVVLLNLDVSICFGLLVQGCIAVE